MEAGHLGSEGWGEAVPLRMAIACYGENLVRQKYQAAIGHSVHVLVAFRRFRHACGGSLKGWGRPDPISSRRPFSLRDTLEFIRIYCG